MSRESEWSEVEAVECVRETTKAIWVVVDEKKHWVPKSIVHPDSEVRGQDDKGTLIVKTWFAEKEAIGD